MAVGVNVQFLIAPNAQDRVQLIVFLTVEVNVVKYCDVQSLLLEKLKNVFSMEVVLDALFSTARNLGYLQVKSVLPMEVGVDALSLDVKSRLVPPLSIVENASFYLGKIPTLQKNLVQIQASNYIS